MVEKIKDLRRLTQQQRENLLAKYRAELMHMKAQLSAGGSIDDPGRIFHLKKTIARLLTIQREEQLAQQTSA